MKYLVAVLCLAQSALAQTGTPSWNGVELNGGASLTTQPLTETFTVGAGGVAANTLVTTNSSSPANIISATGNAVYGVAISAVAAGETVEVARYGQVACLVDAGGAMQGDLVIAGTVNATYCKDSGQTLPINIPAGTRIVGLFRTAAPAGSTAMVELTPDQFGLQAGETALSLNGVPQGTFSTWNLLPSTGLTWQLTPNAQTLSIAPELDSAVVPTKTAANTYVCGAKQSMAPNTTTAGLNLSSAPLPAVPVLGDLAIDLTGNLNWYDGLAWRLGTVADTTLTPGAPVFGNGTNHVTVGNTTGSGSVVLAITPALINPLISSFVNANHDHSSAANGGGLSVKAFNNGINASSATFLRGDGTWANVASTTANQNIRRVTFAFDGGASPLSGTLTRCNNVDFGGAIQQFVAIGDYPGSATIKILTTTLASYAGPASASDISNGGETISGAASKQDSALANWTTALTPNTVICVQVSSPSGFTWLQGELAIAAN